MLKRVLMCCGLVMLPSIAFGASRSNVGVTGGVGTLGFNVGASYRINDYLSVGGSLNRYTYSRNANYKGVNYSASLQFSSEILYVNVYPFSGGFHLTGGWIHNGNSLSMAGQPDQNGNYTFNGDTYSAQQAGTVTAGMGFRSSATYLGVGWGGNGSWGMTFDIGAMNQGAPTFNLNVSGSASNPQLASDVNQQRSTVQNSVNSFTWYPQIALGFYFHF